MIHNHGVGGSIPPLATISLAQHPISIFYFSLEPYHFNTTIRPTEHLKQKRARKAPYFKIVKITVLSQESAYRHLIKLLRLLYNLK